MRWENNEVESICSLAHPKDTKVTFFMSKNESSSSKIHVTDSFLTS